MRNYFCTFQIILRNISFFSLYLFVIPINFVFLQRIKLKNRVNSIKKLSRSGDGGFIVSVS